MSRRDVRSIGDRVVDCDCEAGVDEEEGVGGTEAGNLRDSVSGADGAREGEYRGEKAAFLIAGVCVCDGAILAA